jgi:hypothetical protein
LRFPCRKSSQSRARANQPGALSDVIGQFNALSQRPDPMGWDIGKVLDPSMPDPSVCRHYEGIARCGRRPPLRAVAVLTPFPGLDCRA